VHSALPQQRTENAHAGPLPNESPTRAKRCPGATLSRRRSTRPRSSADASRRSQRRQPDPFRHLTSSSRAASAAPRTRLRRRAALDDAVVRPVISWRTRRECTAHPGRQTRSHATLGTPYDQGTNRAGPGVPPGPGGMGHRCSSPRQRLTEVAAAAERGRPGHAGDHETPGPTRYAASGSPAKRPVVVLSEGGGGGWGGGGRGGGGHKTASRNDLRFV